MRNKPFHKLSQLILAKTTRDAANPVKCYFQTCFILSLASKLFLYQQTPDYFRTLGMELELIQMELSP